MLFRCSEVEGQSITVNGEQAALKSLTSAPTCSSTRPGKRSSDSGSFRDWRDIFFTRRWRNPTLRIFPGAETRRLKSGRFACEDYRQPLTGR
jgi:hypothetical protein